MRKSVIGIIVFLSLLLFTSTSFAKETTWTDKNYNFNNVKKVFEWPTRAAKGVVDPYALQKSEEIIKQQFGVLNIQWVTWEDVRKGILEDQGIDLAELFEKDRKKHWKVFYESLPKYADVLIFCEIRQFGYLEKYVPPETYTFTTPDFVNMQGHGYDSRGNYFSVSGTASVEREHSITFGGYTYENPTAALTVTMYDCKTRNIVWGYSNASAGKGGNPFHSKTPEVHMKWLSKEAIKQIPLAKKTDKNK